MSHGETVDDADAAGSTPNVTQSYTTRSSAVATEAFTSTPGPVSAIVGALGAPGRVLITGNELLERSRFMKTTDSFTRELEGTPPMNHEKRPVEPTAAGRKYGAAGEVVRGAMAIASTVAGNVAAGASHFLKTLVGNSVKFGSFLSHLAHFRVSTPSSRSDVG
jgi:hypothetical protein